MSRFSQRHWEATQGEVSSLIGLLGVEHGASARHPCVAGRHSPELARRGFQATGMGCIDTYLHPARARAAAEGLDLALIQSDMRAFLRQESFDAAITLYAFFGYSEEPAGTDARRLVVVATEASP